MKLQKILIAFFSLIIMSANFAYSQNQTNNTKEALKKTLFKKWDALKKGDVDSAKKIMHVNHIAIRHSSGIHNKNNSIYSHLNNKSIEIINIEPIGDFNIEIFDDSVGIIYGKVKFTDIVHGKKTIEKLDFSDVYIFKNGAWQNIFWHSSISK